jgi:hypothetical protein
MRRLILFAVAAAGLVSATAEAGAGCCACGRVRAYSARGLVYGERVLYAPAGTSPCFVRAVAEAFPPPPARVVLDLRAGIVTIRDPWSGTW